MVNMSLKIALAVIVEKDRQRPLISDHTGSHTTSTA